MTRNIWSVAALLLVLASAPVPALANVFTTADFKVVTPDLSNLVAVEGSGPCSLYWGNNQSVRCDSLNVTFTIINTSSSILSMAQSGGGPTFISGDSSDYLTSSEGPDPACFSNLAVGGTCAITINYITSPISTQSNENQDFGLSETGLTVQDQFSPPWPAYSSGNANMYYQLMVVDSAVEPGSLALMLVGVLAMVGIRGTWRKRPRFMNSSSRMT